ncbi:MAG: hypothetical protein U0350_30500 [Caldilineaceae bacterium]
MNRLSRSTALKTAAVISLFLNLFGMMASLPLLVRGAVPLEAPPYFVTLLGFVLNIIAIVAAYGVWHHRRWAIVLTLLAVALNTVSAIPGIFFAPNLFWQLTAMIGTVLSILIIVLCLWRNPKAPSV